MVLPAICYGLLVYESILIASAVGGIALRFISMFKVRRKVKNHDFIVIAALVGCMGYIIATMIATANYGYGYHERDVPPKKLTLALKVFWAVEPFWALSTVSFRIAILLLYIELFGLVKNLRYCARVLLVIVSAWGVACIISQMLFCRPIDANWDLTVHGKCGNTMAMLVWSAVINMLLDLVIVTLPLPIIWKLHMTTRKKIGVTLQFSIGLLLCGVNIGRIVLPARCGTTDTTYCSPGTFMLSATELAGGIWAACLPLLGPLFTSGGDKSAIFPSQARDHKTNHSDKSANHGTESSNRRSQGYQRPQSQAYDPNAIDLPGELSDQASTLLDDASVKEPPKPDSDDSLSQEDQAAAFSDSVIRVQRRYDVASVTRTNSRQEPGQR